MFQELLDKASLVGHKMAVYRILTKDAQTLTAEDLEELSAMVSEAAALEFVDSRFLLEETALSLYGLLEGENPPERQRFFSACAAVMGELEGALPEGELAGLADCLEAFRGLRRGRYGRASGVLQGALRKARAACAGPLLQGNVPAQDAGHRHAAGPLPGSAGHCAGDFREHPFAGRRQL